MAVAYASDKAASGEKSSTRSNQFLIEEIPLPTAGPSVPPLSLPIKTSDAASSAPPAKRSDSVQKPLPAAASADTAGQPAVAAAPLSLPMTPSPAVMRFSSPVSSPASVTPPATAPAVSSALPPASAATVPLGRIVVSSRRAATSLEDVPADVTVVSQKEIESLPADDPGEALTYVSGVQADTRTGFGHFRPLSIQGSESRQVLVMVDGIPFNNQLSGQADILPALPVNDIDQIEILKGAGSSAWGSSLGGVVNIVTVEPATLTAPRRRIGTKVSEFGSSQGLEWGGPGPWRDSGYYVSTEYSDAGGARTAGGVDNRDDTLHRKLFGKFQMMLSDLVKWTTSLGYSGSEANEGVFETAPIRTRMPYLARYGQTRLDIDPSDKEHVEAAVQLNRQTIQQETFFEPSDASIGFVSSHDEYYGLSLKNVTRFDDHNSIVAGYDLSTHEIKSTFLSSSRGVLIHAPYANYELDWKPFTVTAGVRYDINGEFGEQWSPSAGAVWTLPFIPKTSLRVNAARGFNAPPLLWKYFRDIAPGLTENNPDLRPERAWTYETGIETSAIPRLWLKAGVYRSDISGAIATAVTPDGFFIKENFDQFRQMGVEFRSKLAVTKAVDVSLAGDFNDVEDRLTHETVQGRGTTRPSWRAGVECRLPGGFETGVWARYDRWDSLSSEQPNDRKFIYDAKVSKKFKRLLSFSDASVFAGVFNLTNSKYWSDINLPLPSRYFEGGLSLDF